VYNSLFVWGIGKTGKELNSASPVSSLDMSVEQRKRNILKFSNAYSYVSKAYFTNTLILLLRYVDLTD
jgi:hypothetical protein